MKGKTKYSKVIKPSCHAHIVPFFIWPCKKGRYPLIKGDQSCLPFFPFWVKVKHKKVIGTYMYICVVQMRIVESHKKKKRRNDANLGGAPMQI
jgi:hypothetical protein